MDWDWVFRKVSVGDKVAEQVDYWGNVTPIGYVQRVTRCFFWTRGAKYRRSDGKRIGRTGWAWPWTRRDDRRIKKQQSIAELSRSLRDLSCDCDLLTDQELQRLSNIAAQIKRRLY